MICEEDETALSIVQVSPLDGVLSIYNQVLQNALICGFLTIHDKCDVRVADYETGYNGWIINGKYEDFSQSEALKAYMEKNPNKWFCIIIKEQL